MSDDIPDWQQLLIMTSSKHYIIGNSLSVVYTVVSSFVLSPRTIKLELIVKIPFTTIKKRTIKYSKISKIFNKFRSMFVHHLRYYKRQ